MVTTLIANLGTGKGTWGHVSRLIEDGKFDKVLLITNDFGKEKFKAPDNGTFVLVDTNQSINDILQIIDPVIAKIDDDIKLNMISGSGKEHMALIISLQKAKKNYEFVAVTKEGVASF